MVMTVTLAACCNPQSLVHRDESHESNHDRNSQKEVLVRLDQSYADLSLWHLTKEDLGQEMEQGVAEQATDSKGYHHVQTARIDVGGHKGEDEVRRARDVGGSEEGVDSWRGGREQHLEGLLKQGGCFFFSNGMVRSQLLDNGAGLEDGLAVVAVRVIDTVRIPATVLQSPAC